MKLYHGTSESHAEKILKHGIVPRGKTRKTNWKHSIESNPDTVYLTTVYAGYFAMNVVKVLNSIPRVKDEQTQERAVIFEIDHDKLDKNLLRPDEDFLEQVFRGLDDFDADMHTRTRHYRKTTDLHRDMWAKSLNHLGTCGYAGEIPPSAFTRVSYWSWQLTPLITRGAMNPAITIENYAIMQGQYAAITRWLMGETISVEEYMGLGASLISKEQRDALWSALLSESKGVDVNHLRGRLPACYGRPWAGIFDKPEHREIERGPKQGIWLQKQMNFNSRMDEAMKRSK